MSWGIEHLRAMGVAVTELRLVRGAARNELWQRVLADVCDVPVRRLVETESAALGAALQAMWAVRRRGEPELAIATVVEPFLALDDRVVEPGPATGRYRVLRADSAAALAKHHGYVPPS